MLIFTLISNNDCRTLLPTQTQFFSILAILVYIIGVGIFWSSPQPSSSLCFRLKLYLRLGPSLFLFYREKKQFDEGRSD